MVGKDEGKPFDLEERTALFGEAVIEFAKKVPFNQITRSLIDQVVRSSTSVRPALRRPRELKADRRVVPPDADW